MADLSEDNHEKIALSRKTYAMVTIGILATIAIITNGVFAWFYSPQDQTVINSIIEFLKNVVLTVIGFLAGASRPDDPKDSTLQKKNAILPEGNPS